MLLVCTNMPKIAVHRSSKSQNFQWHASCRGVGALAASKNWELAESADSGNIVGPILSDLCAMCLQACCRGPASASSILPQTLSDSQWLSDRFCPTPRIEKSHMPWEADRSPSRRLLPCIGKTGIRVSISTFIYDIIRHYTTYIINSLVVSARLHCLSLHNISFNHLPSSSIISHDPPSSYHLFISFLCTVSILLQLWLTVSQSSR